MEGVNRNLGVTNATQINTANIEDETKIVENKTWNFTSESTRNPATNAKNNRKLNYIQSTIVVFMSASNIVRNILFISVNSRRGYPIT